MKMALVKSSTIHQGPLSAVVGGTALGGGDDSRLADKLRELQTARDEGFLTESEVQAARQNVIASLTNGSSDILCVQKVTSPESALVLDKVDYTECRDGSWNGAANGIIRKLKEAGVQRGQVISIDAHNNGPNEAAIFSAHYCKSLPGKGPLDIQYQCENTADQGWVAFYQNAAKFAEQNTGDRSDLVAITASVNWHGQAVMYTFYYTPVSTKSIRHAGQCVTALPSRSA